VGKRRGRGRGRKETLADKPQGFESLPHGLSSLRAHTKVSCHNRIIPRGSKCCQ